LHHAPQTIAILAPRDQNESAVVTTTTFCKP
jgi:hypothetical protein